MAHRVLYEDLGPVPYKVCWDLQLAYFQETVRRKQHNAAHPDDPLETESRLLFCSHPHVYTLGKSGSEDNLLLQPSELSIHGAEFYRINRGGDITYHGPGQLVGYPIFDLDHFFTDIHRFIDRLEEAIIRVLGSYGIVAGRGPKGFTGVWVDWGHPEKARKIAAFGMHTSRWVTMHGFALNINTDLSYYAHIIPCGIADKAVTSMQAELGRRVDEQEVKLRMKDAIAEVLGFTYPQGQLTSAG